MAVIFIEKARVGMRICRPVYSSTGAKLLTMGTVLTKENLHMLKKHNVNRIEVDDSVSPVSDHRNYYAKGINDAARARNERALLHSTMKKIPLFASLNNEHLELLTANFRIEKVQASTILFREKEPGDSFFVIVRGSTKIYTQSNEGKEKILSVFRSGDSFGELSLLDGKPRSASAQTLEETEHIVISRDSFMKVLQSHFDIAKIIMKEMIRRISDTKQHVEDLAFLDAHSRVVKSLVKLTNRFGKRTDYSVEVELPLDYNELAQMSGVKVRELHDVLYDMEEKQLLKMNANYFSVNLLQLRL
ncbi:Crp/Fnr family transcriptional regulator [Cohnella silvisoli]|uniref:Crp/Fnr family transcriptional regulator n=1 Tax=Cohnella silvisoli TaxID=2873699 RepID=A0ABV1KQV4_9BACL|nr:Crp/Fnr family transcriptional regulator [Cohnella silvisoli]MCD9022164.1 Crp/Fnr family transcriptional regulator [Cohnella silvisoli]